MNSSNPTSTATNSISSGQINPPPKEVVEEQLQYLYSQLKNQLELSKKLLKVKRRSQEHESVDLSPIFTNPDFSILKTGSKAPRTIVEYRTRQLKFIEWARSTPRINSTFPDIVTSRRAILYMEDELNKPNYRRQTNKFSTYDLTLSALSDLLQLQKATLVNVMPNLSDEDESEGEGGPWLGKLRNERIKSFMINKERQMNLENPSSSKMNDEGTEEVSDKSMSSSKLDKPNMRASSEYHTDDSHHVDDADSDIRNTEDEDDSINNYSQTSNPRRKRKSETFNSNTPQGPSLKTIRTAQEDNEEVEMLSVDSNDDSASNENGQNKRFIPNQRMMQQKYNNNPVNRNLSKRNSYPNNNPNTSTNSSEQELLRNKDYSSMKPPNQNLNTQKQQHTQNIHNMHNAHNKSLFNPLTKLANALNSTKQLPSHSHSPQPVSASSLSSNYSHSSTVPPNRNQQVQSHPPTMYEMLQQMTKMISKIAAPNNSNSTSASSHSIDSSTRRYIDQKFDLLINEIRTIKYQIEAISNSVVSSSSGPGTEQTGGYMDFYAATGANSDDDEVIDGQSNANNSSISNNHSFYMDSLQGQSTSNEASSYSLHLNSSNHIHQTNNNGNKSHNHNKRTEEEEDDDNEAFHDAHSSHTQISIDGLNGIQMTLENAARHHHENAGNYSFNSSNASTSHLNGTPLKSLSNKSSQMSPNTPTNGQFTTSTPNNSLIGRSGNSNSASNKLSKNERLSSQGQISTGNNQETPLNHHHSRQQQQQHHQQRQQQQQQHHQQRQQQQSQPFHTALASSDSNSLNSHTNNSNTQTSSLLMNTSHQSLLSNTSTSSSTAPSANTSTSAVPPTASDTSSSTANALMLPSPTTANATSSTPIDSASSPSREGFTPRDCKSIKDYYEDYQRLVPQRVYLLSKYGNLRSVPKYRTFQRRQYISRIVDKFLQNGFSKDEVFEILENDLKEKNMKVHVYCDHKKDYLFEKYHIDVKKK